MQCNMKRFVMMSGATWLLLGSWLMMLGLSRIAASMGSLHAPWLETLALPFGGAANAAVVLIAVALFVGFLKGRVIMTKTAVRMVERFRKLSAPISWKDAYPSRYYLLILVMMSLGMAFNFMGLSLDVRGFFDVAIGSALINGSTHYYKVFCLTNA